MDIIKSSISFLKESTLNSCFEYKLNTPNYAEWLQYERWKLADLAALLVEVDPDQINELEEKITKKQHPFNPVFIDSDGNPLFTLGSSLLDAYKKLKNYQEKVKTLERSKLFSNLERQATPQECINWATKKELPIPDELNKYINNIANIDSKNKIVTSTSKIGKTSSHTQEKTELIKILHSLIKSAYKREFKEIKSIQFVKNNIMKYLANEDDPRHKDTVERYISWIFFHVNNEKYIVEKKKYKEYEKAYLKESLDKKERESILNIMLGAIIKNKTNLKGNKLDDNVSEITDSVINDYSEINQDFISSLIKEVLESKSRS